MSWPAWGSPCSWACWRAWSGNGGPKEAGLRTFAFASMLGCLGGLLGTPYALAALGMLTSLVVLMNLDHLRQAQAVELTTSAALMLMGFAGILCGLGHTISPASIAVITTALLAWKTPLSGLQPGPDRTGTAGGHPVAAAGLRHLPGPAEGRRTPGAPSSPGPPG